MSTPRKNLWNKDYALCIGNISKGFTINVMKKNGIWRGCKFFSVDINPTDTNDILDFHKYFMKRTYKIMFGLIKKIFIGLLTGLVTKCVSLRNQKFMFNLLFLIYILMNTVKNFITIHLQLN